jgi:hypothetical protein
MESIESSPSLLHEPKVAVSPRNGAFIENEHRTRHAVRGTRKALGAGSDVSVSHG